MKVLAVIFFPSIIIAFVFYGDEILRNIAFQSFCGSVVGSVLVGAYFLRRIN